MNTGSAASPVAARVHAALDRVTDPEIPVVTIRELGILRDVRVAGDAVEVVITPTYSGCPAMGQIEDDIRMALQDEPVTVQVKTRLAPAWTTDWITPTARERLRAYGIAPPNTPAAADGRVVQLHRHWSRHLAAADAVPCPRCGSSNTTETSHFGSTACKALFKCLDCLEPFDHFKPY